MKVLLLHNFTDDGTPSMHRYGDELASALRADGFDQPFEVVSERRSKPRLLQRLSGARLAARGDSAYARYVHYPLACTTLRSDVYHILDHGYSQLGLSFPAARTVITCHDIIPLLASKRIIDMPLPRTVGATFRFRLACMRRSGHVIADSAATRSGLVEFAGMQPEDITVVHPGVNEAFAVPDSTRDRRETRAEIGISQSENVVLHVGTRGRYKNLATVLRAVAHLRFALSTPALLLRVGSDLSEDEWDLVDRLNLRPYVRSLGSVAGDQALARIYAASDVLAFPSLWEGFGWPPLEAMACGLPVVVSNRGSLPEVVGPAGLIVPATDAEALANALKRVLVEPGLAAELKRRGTARAGSFTWSRCAAQTYEVYRELDQRTNAVPRAAANVPVA